MAKVIYKFIEDEMIMTAEVRTKKDAEMMVIQMKMNEKIEFAITSDK